MTYEKASDLLAMIEVKESNELIVNSWWGSFVKDYKDALDMAIKALEQESCYDLINQRATTCRHGGHCEWVACDKCNHYEPDSLIQQPCEDVVSRETVLDTLDKMDKALDTDRTVENYKELLTECYKDLPSVGKDINVTTTDCVSREQLERELHAQMAVDAITKGTALDMLNHLPPVTLQEKTGKWIYTGDYITDGMLKCSSCGYEHDVADRFLYCPNCGCRMRGDSNGNE